MEKLHYSHILYRALQIILEIIESIINCAWDIGVESGNKLTGVPKFVNTSSLKLVFPKRFDLFLSYNFTDKTPLNNGNSVYSSSYQLFGAKLSWEYMHRNSFSFQLFAGTENILNISYSLGNDINAAASRYYNPAPTRTYFCGIQLRF